MCSKLSFKLDNGISQKLVYYICYQPISPIKYLDMVKIIFSFIISNHFSIAHIELFTVNLSPHITIYIAGAVISSTSWLSTCFFWTIKTIWEQWKSGWTVENETCTHLLSSKLLLLSRLTASAYGVCLNLLLVKIKFGISSH